MLLGLSGLASSVSLVLLVSACRLLRCGFVFVSGFGCFRVFGGGFGCLRVVGM